MNKMRVKCIHCGKEWEKEALFPWGPEDCSSSLCKACFVKVAKPLIQKRQRLEGNFDCFGKGETYCDQWGCKYRSWCLTDAPYGPDDDREHENSPTIPSIANTGEMHLS